MKVRSLCPLAAAVGVWVGGPAQAKDSTPPVPPQPAAVSAPKAISAKPAAPAPKPADNQKLAEAVAERLTASALADGADVTLVTEAGVVTVTGTARDAGQKKAILQEIRVVPGVKMVRDGITVGPAVVQAQATAPPAALPPVGPVMQGQVAAVPPAMMGMGGGPLVEPAPLGAGGGGPADGFAPPMPPNAWPTYAPYNNVSRVGYPTAYPYNAFPFIGPFYPFPKVPLGWRSVTMTWEDGHWWYGRTSTPHDYWRVRFW